MHKRMERKKLEWKIREEARSILQKTTTPRTISSLQFLAIVHEMLRKGTTRKKRSIYYEAVEVFRSQSRVDALIKRYTRRFGCEMEDLGIRASLKGLFSGRIVFISHKDEAVELGGKNMIPEMAEIAAVRHSAKCVLVVEKDTVLSMVEDPSLIVVCGKGYPCRNTLRLLALLEQQTEILCMTDFDPYGLHIFSVYKRCIHRMRRIGLCSGDLFRYGIEPGHCIQLNKYDRQMIRKLVAEEPVVRDETRFIEGLGFKLELEALVARSGFSILAHLKAWEYDREHASDIPK